MDGACKLNSRFLRPNWDLKIYVLTLLVVDFTAPCTGRHGEPKHSLAARLDCPVNDDSISRGSLIIGFYYQIIRAISEACCEVEGRLVMRFFLGYQLAIVHQCHGGVANLW